MRKRRHETSIYLPKPAQRGPDERNALVVQWLGLVPWAIYEMRPRLRWASRLLGAAEAVQIGNMTLLRAAELWEPKKGKFSTYATKVIRWRIFQAARKVLAGQEHESLTDYIDHRAEIPYETLERKSVRDIIERLLASLTPREGEILRLRFGLGRKAHTLDEVAKRYGVCRERVRQLEARATLKMSSGCRIETLATALGLQQCRHAECSAWTEFEMACPQCRESGCPSCIRIRSIKGYGAIRSCKPCYLKLKAEVKKEGWDSYSPLPLSNQSHAAG